MRPQGPPTKKVLKFNMSFHDSVKKIFFSKHQNRAILVLKLKNLRTWTTLKSSVVIFSGLRNPCSLIDLGSLCNLNGLNSLYSPSSSKNFLILMVWSSLSPKQPLLVILCAMDHQKSNFSLRYGIFSVRGRWGWVRSKMFQTVDQA